MDSTKLKMKWYKTKKDFYVYGGDGRHRQFVFWYLMGKRFSPTEKEPLDSFLEGLDKRGYDITTFKMEIKLKKDIANDRERI